MKSLFSGASIKIWYLIKDNLFENLYKYPYLSFRCMPIEWSCAQRVYTFRTLSCYCIFYFFFCQSLLMSKLWNTIVFIIKCIILPLLPVKCIILPFSDLSGNKINCGCDLIWTKNASFSIIATCQSPTWVKGRSLADLTREDLCSKYK